MESETPTSQPALSPQQKRFMETKDSRLAVYKKLIVGSGSWLSFIGFETYNLLLSNLGSILGLGLRSLIAPLFFKSCGKGVVIGRGVTIRIPNRISIGAGTIIDDGAAINVGQDEDPSTGINIGNKVLVGRGSIISVRGGRIKLGSGVNISSYCRIATGTSLEIDESVLIAAYTYIGAGNHSFGDASRPIIEQNMTAAKGVKIGKNAWIGAHVMIMDGVTIGENAVIGAHALVREDVPANAIVGGVPAKLLKMRSAT